MRAVIYARYSTDLQSEASIEDQVRLCTARIEREGWRLVESYADRATSGASTLRPGYQRMLRDAQAGRFDVVIAEALDRLSRDQEHVAALHKQLGFAGVRLITLTEGEINELHVGLKGTMNALFLKDLAAKTRRGLEGRVRSGKSGGGICYGYDVVRAVDAQGNPVRGDRTIDAAEAAVVVRIFEAYRTGRSPRQIARMLNDEGIAGPGGRPWGDTTIRGNTLRGTGVLHNELYVGRLVWNRQRFIKDPATGRRVARLNPPEAWVVQEVPDLRIVDDALWTAVQERLTGVRESPRVVKARASEFWKHRRPQTLLTGLVHCGCCGGLMATQGQDYLGCSTARRQGTCTNRKLVRRGAIETVILEGLRERLMRPDMVAAFAEAFVEETNRQRKEAEVVTRATARELAEVERKLDGLVDAIAGGLRSSSLQRSLDELEARKAVLEERIRETAAPQPYLHPNLAELYRQKVVALTDLLASPDDGTEALELVRSLIERVDVRPEGKGWEVGLIGAIADMIKLATNAEAFVREPLKSSVKVVAGARNPRELTLPGVAV